MKAVSLAKQIAAVQEQRDVLYNSYKVAITIDGRVVGYELNAHEVAESMRCLDAAIVTLRKSRKGA